MSTHNDGGPAFPRTESRDSSGPCYVNDSCARIVSTGGMSLRDWFAGQALAGLLADTNRTGTVDAYANDAYIYADAMLAASARKAEDKQ